MERPHFDSVEWQDTYLCHIERIDKHRRKLIEIFNFIIDKYAARTCKDTITQPFFKLAFATESYFYEEEVLLKQLEYPQYREVRTRHKETTKHIIQFKEDFSEGKETTCQDMLFYLTLWIQQEVINYDPQIIGFLKQKGV
ncbi:MAG: hypothetical protein RIS47_1200 [Bacteroidota bacterium]|jgi:hemerythrin